jgi:hypothetical protein
MTKWMIPCAAVTVAAMAAAFAADAPIGTLSDTHSKTGAADTCRPQPLCRGYVSDGDQLIPAPPPNGGVELRGKYSAAPGGAEDQNELTDASRRLPASQSSEPSK